MGKQAWSLTSKHLCRISSSLSLASRSTSLRICTSVTVKTPSYNSEEFHIMPPTVIGWGCRSESVKLRFFYTATKYIQLQPTCHKHCNKLTGIWWQTDVSTPEIKTWDKNSPSKKIWHKIRQKYIQRATLLYIQQLQVIEWKHICS